MKISELKSWAVFVLDTILFRRKLKNQLATTHADLRLAVDSLKVWQKDEASARAQLMQLRVHGESIRGRTGFMVSAFVPNDVLDRLVKSTDAQKAAFRDRVAAELVSLALRGLFRVTQKGTMHAMIFEPLGPESNKRIASAIFETADGKHEIVHSDNSIDVRQIRAEERRRLNENN